MLIILAEIQIYSGQQQMTMKSIDQSQVHRSLRSLLRESWEKQQADLMKRIKKIVRYQLLVFFLQT